MAATEGDMIKVNEFTYLYCLKESKEYRYYELVSWVRDARIVRDLPSSFRYWKSQFFFVSGDEWETPSDKIWGDLPRLLRRWKTPGLGASPFLPILRTIEDFDDLVDPQTLALHCLSPEPSAYILRTIEIEEKKSKYLLNSSLLLFSSSFPFFFF